MTATKSQVARDLAAHEGQFLKDAEQQLNYAVAEWQTEEGVLSCATHALACVALAAELRARREALT